MPKGPLKLAQAVAKWSESESAVRGCLTATSQCVTMTTYLSWLPGEPSLFCLLPREV